MALEHGKKRNRWVFPFDGNSFLTITAWKELLTLTQKAELDSSIKYIIVPMARLMNNRDATNPLFVPDAIEEPQVVFKYDSSQVYNDKLRYGRRSKV